MSDVEILIDSCPEDDSIWIWYGVLWDAMLEANDERAAGLKWLIDNGKRPHRWSSLFFGWTWFTMDTRFEGIPRYAQIDSDLIQPMVKHYVRYAEGDETPGDAIRFFLEAYCAIYGKVPA